MQAVTTVGFDIAKATHFGAAYFIPTFYVPLLLITHGMVFRILLKAAGQ
jgi:hypothetical protein